ncbi:hypothetical protein AAHN97_06330 [Chitinophaga niabensis]|uniref:hypothetical protein n=1 Tax=Chitinophaga niabensis TaxID=536979 RepID=UPI0031BA30AB
MYGWYINYSFLPRATGELRQFLDANEIILLDQYMVENIDEIYQDLKCRLLRHYVERNGPLSAAFNAHEKGEYYLSIPVFFAQVDGICKEHTAVSFFLKENETHLPRVRNWVLAEQRFAFNRAMAAALLVNGGIPTLL